MYSGSGMEWNCLLGIGTKDASFIPYFTSTTTTNNSSYESEEFLEEGSHRLAHGKNNLISKPLRDDQEVDVNNIILEMIIIIIIMILCVPLNWLLTPQTNTIHTDTQPTLHYHHHFISNHIFLSLSFQLQILTNVFSSFVFGMMMIHSQGPLC
jgi:hypothetical protein